MILVEMELSLPVGKASNSTRCHIKKKSHYFCTDLRSHDSELDGLRSTKTSFMRVGDPAEI